MSDVTGNYLRHICARLIINSVTGVTNCLCIRHLNVERISTSIALLENIMNLENIMSYDRG